VPMFTCGLLRSNFAFAIAQVLLCYLIGKLNLLL